MICATGPMPVGRAKEAPKGTTHPGSTGTPSKATEPEPVVRWPKPSQSSVTVTPGASRGTKARCCTSSSATTRVGIQWA